MAKGTLLTEADIKNIRAIYEGMPTDSKAETVRQKASQVLKRELGLSTVQRILIQARKHRKEIKDMILDLDKPWSIGALEKYPYLEIVLPELLLWKKEIFQKIPMSIRWALWYYRLHNIHKVTKGMDKANGGKTPQPNFGDIHNLASLYSDYERQWERAGLPLPADTSQFDDTDINNIKQNLLNWYKKGLDKDTYNSLKRSLDDFAKCFEKEGEVNG